MATTSNTYTGNGSNKLFSITFPYLETSDIDVYLNGTLQTITTQYFFANATTVEFVAAPGNGVTVLLKRNTDEATISNSFFPGSSIKAADLNDNFDQVLFLAQETNNNVANAVAGQIPAGTITNLQVNDAANINATKLAFTQSGTGATTRTIAAKLTDIVNVKDFGAVGDGIVDDTIAIQTAINSSHRKAVYFPRGIYKVTDTLNITVLSYSLVGERTERGTNTQFYRSGEYSAVRINFAPVDTTKFLVNMFQATASINIIGPFEHKNICFTLNGANGLQFGSESLDIEDGPTANGQAYVHGVRFDNCNFETTGGTYGSDANGVITLTGRRHIGLAKSFESVVRDCSFSNGDYGIRTLGCDKVNVTGCRAVTQRPLDFNGKNSFTVQHTVHDFQCESWLISPVRNNNVDLAISHSRFEANVGSPTGYGRFVLPSCTATVTANSATLTFSRTMDNILIPGWSIIEITNGTNTDICHIAAVSGTTVTVSTQNFRFTWSGTATTVTRIHTIGPLHAPGPFGSCYTNISAGSGTNCPAFVYVGSKGSMYLTNCFADTGAYGNIECLAVGNRSSQEQFAMNGQMVLNSCTSLLTPNVPSPLVRTINWNESNGESQKDSNRQLGADTFDSLNKAQRKWIYTPARYQTSGNNKTSLVFKKLAVDAGTSQQVYAWFLDGTNPSGRSLDILDNSLPSATSGGLKLLVRAKAVSAGTTMSIVTGSDLGGGTLTTLTLSTDWKTYIVPFVVPTFWGSGGTSDRILQLGPSADVYVAAVVLLDENGGNTGTYVNNSVGKILAHKRLLLANGVGQVIARGGGVVESFKVKVYGANASGNDNYATVYAEYIVQTSTFSGSYDIRGVSLQYKQKQSVNAGVIDVDIAITSAVVSGLAEITATATLTGSVGSPAADVYFEIEGLGTPSITLSPS